MGRNSKSTEKTVNIAYYNALTGELSIYKNLRVLIRYNQMRFKDPNTGKQTSITCSRAEDGKICIREQVAILWSTSPIDIDAFKKAVWDYRLEHYGHMVANALAIIRQQKDSLEKAYAALCN